MENANTMNMEISSSNFENNSGVLGGAIYIGKGITNNNIISITMKDTTFNNNIAENFGGAFYSDYDTFNVNSIKNVHFDGNSAYAGGCFYLKNDNNDIENIEDLKKLSKNNTSIEYINNKSDSHGEDYGTNPVKIELMTDISKILELKSGDVLQLKFIMTDKYGQLVKDASKLYSSIKINIEMDEISNDEDGIQRKLKGSTCYFTNGILFFIITIINIIIFYFFFFYTIIYLY